MFFFLPFVDIYYFTICCCHSCMIFEFWHVLPSRVCVCFLLFLFLGVRTFIVYISNGKYGACCFVQIKIIKNESQPLYSIKHLRRLTKPEESIMRKREREKKKTIPEIWYEMLKNYRNSVNDYMPKNNVS